MLFKSVVSVVAWLVIGFSSCTVYNFSDPAGPQFVGSHAVQKAAGQSGQIKIVSYNIAWGKHIDEAVNEMAVLPELRGADILLLQEMNIHGVKEIAERAGYNYLYYPGSIHPYNHSDIGNAILSAWPISESKKLILPHKQSWNDRIRTATVATITIHDIPIRIYNVHTATVMMSEAKRADQLLAVVADVNPNGERVIVGGDFNTVWRSSVQHSMNLFRAHGFVCASDTAGATVEALGLFPLCLDHFFVKGLQVISCGVEEDANASDHFPVWVVLDYKSDESFAAR